MAIEKRTYHTKSGDTSSHTVMTECPMCNEEIPDGNGFRDHWEGEKGLEQCRMNSGGEM